MSKSTPGLVDFAIGLVKSVLNLPEWASEAFWGNCSNCKRMVINPAHQKMTHGLENASYSLPQCQTEFPCTIMYSAYSTCNIKPYVHRLRSGYCGQLLNPLVLWLFNNVTLKCCVSYINKCKEVGPKNGSYLSKFLFPSMVKRVT